MNKVRETQGFFCDFFFPRDSSPLRSRRAFVEDQEDRIVIAIVVDIGDRRIERRIT